VDVQVINFKPHAKGHLVGFFCMVIAGLVVSGCKAFQKSSQLWFSWPSERVQDRGGEVQYREIVSAAGPMMEHLQRAIRAQLRPLLEDGRPPAEEPGQPRRQYKSPEGEDLSQYRSGPPDDDDIPF
jgi:hypothetical protein